MIAVPQAAGSQPRRGPPGGVLVGVPQFVVTAVGFRALDETGWDWLGSDEVYAVFSDLDPRHNDLVTSTFGDVDTGESRTFSGADTCIAPQPACTRGLAAVHFKLSMWESDGGFEYGDEPGYHYRLEHGAQSWDDLIGRSEVSKSAAELVADLPTVGASRDYTIQPSGGDGKYQLTYRITRLADAPRRPVAEPPPPPSISLTATAMRVQVGFNITLTWSGATTTTVDIYRNSAKLVTTANDGSYVDPVSNGTYIYRVCNLGSTTFCSADVSITTG